MLNISKPYKSKPDCIHWFHWNNVGYVKNRLCYNICYMSHCVLVLFSFSPFHLAFRKSQECHVCLCLRVPNLTWSEKSSHLFYSSLYYFTLILFTFLQRFLLPFTYTRVLITVIFSFITDFSRGNYGVGIKKVLQHHPIYIAQVWNCYIYGKLGIMKEFELYKQHRTLIQKKNIDISSAAAI